MKLYCARCKRHRRAGELKHNLYDKSQLHCRKVDECTEAFEESRHAAFVENDPWYGW